MNYKNINKQYKYYIVKVEIMRIKNQKPNEKQRRNYHQEGKNGKNKKRGSTPVLARHHWLTASVQAHTTVLVKATGAYIEKM